MNQPMFTLSYCLDGSDVWVITDMTTTFPESAGQLRIVDRSGNEVAIHHSDNLCDTDVLSELIADVDIDGDCAMDMFTRGLCSWLAVALSERLEGASIIAVYDPHDEMGFHLECPYLLHAGVLVGDQVIDIEGISALETWETRWMTVGGVECFTSRPEAEYLISESSRSNKEYAIAAGIADLLCLVHSPELAQRLQDSYAKFG